MAQLRRARHLPPPQYLAAAVAVHCLLLAAAPALAAGISTSAITLSPMQCRSIAIDFGWTNFDYSAYITTSPQQTSIPAGCLPTDFVVSKLYMGGSCTTQRNNEGSGGCKSSNDGVKLPESTASDTWEDPTTSSATCAGVFADAPSNALVTIPIPSTGYRFDRDSLCTRSQYGWIFVRNSCNQSNSELTFVIKVDSTNYTGGCNTSIFPAWARVSIGIMCGIVAVALIAYAISRCGRRRPPGAAGPAGATTMQMAAPPGVQQGGYYTGSAAYMPEPGYGPPHPPGYPPAPGYQGAWGAPRPPPSGYPHMPAHQQQQQQPMIPFQTVTLGAPPEVTNDPASGAPAPTPPGYPPPPLSSVGAQPVPPANGGGTTAAAGGGSNSADQNAKV